MIKLTLIIACVLGATITAYAQVAVPPFTSLSSQEKFDALSAGSHTSFVGFSGAAAFANLGTGGAMIINNSVSILPPVSPKHDLFGRGVVVPVNPAAWKWHGYDLGKVGGHDEVHITSLGGTLPGYVGMDNLVRR